MGDIAQMSELMADCDRLNWRKIAFVGISDLAEVGVICAHDYPIKVVAVIEPARAGEMFCGLPVEASVAACGALDAVIVTDLTKPEQVFRAVGEELGADRVLAPKLLQMALRKVAKAEPARAAE